MPESRIARADRRSAAFLVRVGDEIRTARLAAGLTLVQVARAVRISPSELSRVERGLAPWVDLGTLTRSAGVVGLDLWFRTYPGGEPLRDAAHLRLTDAFRAMLGPALLVRAEVPIGDPRDLRAWDVTLTDPGSRTCGVELETRLLDAQAQARRISRKAADGDMDRVLLVVANTRANRLAVQAAAPLLGSIFAIDDPAAYESLARGAVPPRDALIFVRLTPRPAKGRLPPHGND